MHIAVGLVGMFRFFRLWRWDYTPYLTGAVVSTALLLIYSGAPNAVRLAKYEVFSRSHHAFIVFFLFLFLHGPVFFYWSCVPVHPAREGAVPVAEGGVDLACHGCVLPPADQGPVR